MNNTLRDNDDKNVGFREEKEVILFSLLEFRELLQKGQFADVQVGYLGLDYLGLL